MKTASDGDNVAVLIDGDNISFRNIAGLMAEVANYGTASVKRIYGDWTNPQMRGWRECLLEHSIVPIQQFAYTTGKNATDGAMIIDAMDLLYTGRFSSFCIVSSDSDFTRLAARIREQGVSVYGFGNRSNSHRALIAACNESIYLDALSVQTDEPKPGPRPLDKAALDGIRKAIRSSKIYESDFVNLTDVGTHLIKLSPDLNARNYGYLKTKNFMEASGIVEIKMKTREPAPPITLVRLRE
ncbi:hypothetical protein M409DRAFT_67859 [Zasmidium cellare ATCC 36951]|uniref:HTH OST-type domain-containing protein n=1 Tax=Zasmidium cellare ATCC 36951 TaxID=1080233 RepID=A0A6A6CBZ7_ZASCE|nr:uncharacterized protein M409DRAFT_67859 [Zasmidium cellare ATCC 36951]KAF2164313.1 hypothetical protein M409DRAFT_67859 [Zasmidium cellare ATCC 36951]